MNSKQTHEAFSLAARIALRILLVCCAGTLLPLPVSADIVVGGDRPVTIHVPTSYDPDTPMPLILHLHGCPSSGEFLESRTGFRPLSESRGFLYAYPDGSNPAGRDACWNAGEAFGDPGRPEVDDVSYLAGLIETAKAELNVDPLRVYVVGRSGGATMVHAMACELSDTLAAVVSVHGSPYSDPSEVCSPSGAVHYLKIRGTSDPLVPYEGGAWQGRPFPGAVEAVEQWSAFNGCSLEFDTLVPRMDLDSPLGAETFGARYVTGCDPLGSAELWTVEGGTHNYLSTRVGDTTAFAIEVVEWLLRHPKMEVPRATFSLSAETVVDGEEVVFDAGASTTATGHSLDSYAWDFGDDSSDETTSSTTTHAFKAPGFYPVELVLTDSRDLTMNAGRRVSVLFRSEDVTPWTTEDVGEVGFPGGSRWEDDCLVIAGAEGNITGTSDALHFAHQKVAGDFQLTARVVDWAMARFNGKLGLSIRESLQPNTRHVTIALQEARGFRHRLLRRETTGGRLRAQSYETYDSPTVWLRIERRGPLISGLLSLDGQSWSEPGTVELLDLPEEVYAGMAASVVGSQGSVATLCDLSITPLEVEPETTFLRGDCDGDGNACSGVNDALELLSWLFLGRTEPPCLAACDPDGNGELELADAVYGLNFCFKGTDAPVAPFPECGVGMDTDTALGCENPNCE